MSASNNLIDNPKFLYNFTKNILDSDTSIRWVGLTDQNGIIINEQYREGVKLLLNKEDNQESVINSIIRQKTRSKFESKIGILSHAIGRYEQLTRCLIPINENYYLLLTIDYHENNIDKIISERVIPLIKQEKEQF